MARIFLSHATRDKAKALELLDWLREQGYDQTFLDSDKDTGIPAGADWERTLYRELERSQAVVILLTSHWLDSKWCFAEFTQARALGKAIFPVVETPAGELVVGSDLQAIDLIREREGGLERLARALVEVALSSAAGFKLEAGVSPFPGFAALSEKQAAVFFGREDDIAALIERLRKSRTQGGARFITILGASGSGKSSLMRAGLLPRLKQDLDNWYVIDPFRPESDPANRLIARLLAAADDSASRRQIGFRPKLPIDDWREQLQGDDPIPALRAIANSIRDNTGRLDTNLLITVDQTEELFALAGEAERKAFLRLISSALDGSLPFFAVATLRSEYLGELQGAPGLSVRFEPYNLQPMPLERLGALVRGPARLANLTVEDGLVAELMSDAGSSDALPLIAFTLRCLYDAERSSGSLTRAGYLALGDASRKLTPLDNAVRKAAEEALPADQRSDERDVALKRAFISNLVQVDAEGNFVRRPAVLEALPEAARDDIRGLTDARLLVTRSKEIEGKERKVVEVAHEALFRVWDKLAAWISEEKDFLVGKTRIRQARGDWLALTEEERAQHKGLLGGILLERARQWIQDRPEAFDAVDRSYVQASIDRADELLGLEREKERRAVRLRKKLFVVAAAAAVIFAVASVAVGILWHFSETAKRQALASLKVAQSKAAMDNDDVDGAVLAALKAVETDDTIETRSAAVTAMLELSPHLAGARDFSEQTLHQLVWSGTDRLRVLTDSALHLRSAADPATSVQEVTISSLIEDDLAKHLRAPALLWDAPMESSALLFPDGSVAGVLRDGTEFRVPAPEKMPSEIAASARSIDIAGNGTMIAALVGVEGILARYCPDLGASASPSCRDTWFPRTGVDAIALDTRGDKIAVASGEAITVQVLTPGLDSVAKTDLDARVMAIDWAESGDLIAVATRDEQLLVLRLANNELHPVARHQMNTLIPILQWSPDANRIAFVCEGKQVCVLDTAPDSGTSRRTAGIERHSGHRNSITGLAWSPDSQQIASISLDGSLRVWTLTPDRTARYELKTSTGARLDRIAIHEADRRIAAGDDEGNIWIWDENGGHIRLKPPEPVAAPVTGLDWNSEGHLVCVYKDRAASYWNLRDTESPELFPKPGHRFNNILVLGNGRYAVPVAGKGIALLSSSETSVRYLEGPGGGIEPWGAASYRTGQRLFVSYTDGSIHQWNMADETYVGALVTAETAGDGADGASRIAVSRDGRLITANRNDDRLVVYAVPNGAVLYTLHLDTLVSEAVSFTDRGGRLAALTGNGDAYVWELDGEHAERLYRFRGVPNRTVTGRAQRQATRLQWLDSDRLAVSTAAGEIQVYVLDPQLWRKRADALFGASADQQLADKDQSNGD